MTDQTIPANLDRDEAQAVREWAARARRTKAQGSVVANAARVLLDVLPAPALPTLADMSDEERNACRWMQADVKPGGLADVKTWGRCVIVTPYDEDGDTGLFSENGKIVWDSSERVTPRPDLPRMEWPGNEKPAPALPEGWRLADHPDFGRVIVTNTTGRNGHVYVVLPSEYGRAFDWHLCAPGELTYIDQEADTADTVPESTLAVGSEWGDADALAQACRESGLEQIVVVDKRGTAGMWDMGLRCWRVTAPDANFAPYTIIHIGREDDQ